MGSEERFHQKELQYLKCCIHAGHNVPHVQIKMKRLIIHTSIDGQRVIRSCANGFLKYHKYDDIEAEVGATMEKWMKKNSSQDAEWKG